MSTFPFSESPNEDGFLPASDELCAQVRQDLAEAIRELVFVSEFLEGYDAKTALEALHRVEVACAESRAAIEALKVETAED